MPGPDPARAAGRKLAAAALLCFVASAPAQQPPPQAAACAACHGPGGNSQQPLVPSLAGQPKLFIENQLVLVREGLREIPPMKGLLDGMADAELVALAQYFSAQKPVRPATGPRDAAAYARGEALSAKMHCGSCHLPDYAGREQIPRLAGQHEAFLLQSMKQLRDRPGPGRDTIMAASLYGLKDADLADLAHFLAHFGASGS
ncbi:c-type cytochrome [Ramlibacter sp. RBP-2]|uniref:C-type cytochrome n=1 Tax=Ramlibacter lithotrophicus TaxID=2606681 RepID=A0A7X6DJE1_9BURK|nr:c-type cytochrome [Ramlibacter lithotrophicus]NKE68266.1 c-type cytochrome [Ramlibacter lithotrophicus]